MEHLAEHETIFFVIVFDFTGHEALEILLRISTEHRKAGVADDLSWCAVVVMVGDNLCADVSEQLSGMHGSTFQQ